MNGSGCKNCPVNTCETMNYRGSICAAQRANFGLGDPQTNADHIRAMSDEELATDLLDMFEEICEDGVPSKEWMLDWLKQPAKEDVE